MLTNTNQKTSFDQFLFSHFKLRLEDEPIVKENPCNIENVELVKELVLKKTVTKKVKFSKSKEVSINTEEKVASLKEAIDSVPEKLKLMNAEELAHQHESEWYHTFKDLQEEIAIDLLKKHPNNHSILKLKSDIKEFWEQLDEHIEKAILELERIFQAFPNMSRVVVIYLLSIIIAIPLVFFSASQSKKLSVDSVVNNKLAEAQLKTIEFTKEMKSDYVAKNSADILTSGKTFIQVAEGLKSGKVAGAYEENNLNLIDNSIKRKISSYYDYLSNLKDEFSYFVKNSLGDN